MALKPASSGRSLNSIHTSLPRQRSNLLLSGAGSGILASSSQERVDISRAPGSPRSLGSPTGAAQPESIFSDKPEDLHEGFRILSQELQRCLARSEALHFEFESHSGLSRAEHEEIRRENSSLKSQMDAIRTLLMEQAPNLLESMNTITSNTASSATSAPQSTVSSPILQTAKVDVNDDTQSESTFFGIPFDADSPMLREKMELFEAQLDEIRQSVKSCVKSGMTFVQAFPLFLEAGLQFADDLQQSTLPMLKVLGEAIASNLDGQLKFLENIHEEFVQPLSRFANTDLKSANHIRAELERKREVFENLESKYMSNRRGKERTSVSAVSSSVSTHSNFDGAPRHNRSANSSGNILAMVASSGGLTGADELLDKKNQTSELRAAEAQYELSRCKLIYTLNHLAMNHRVIVNRCVISLASSMSAYHDAGSARATGLLDNAKILGMDEPDEMRKRMEQSEAQWRRKQQEIESFQFSNPRRQDAEKDLVYEGWLWKRSSNVIRDWKKRFFQIIGGKLVYFRNMNREVVCDVHLCTVREVPRTSGREAAPPRASFEVISNRRALVLMASSDEEKDIWVAAIRKAVEKSLGSEVAHQQTPSLSLPHIGVSTGLANTPSLTGLSASQSLTSDAMSDYMEDASNHKCFECGAPLDSPNWVSINIGVFLCITCSGIHRSLGTHISKVRSLTLDKLPSSQLDILRRLGNARAAKIWEAAPGAYEAKTRGVANFIREKYIDRAFLSRNELELSAEAFETVLVEDNLKRVAWFIAHGKPPFYVSQKSTALHIAASEPTTSAALCEFLLLNGADLNAVDDNGHTPSDIANEKNSTKAQSVFRWWAATSHVKSALTEDV